MTPAQLQRLHEREAVRLLLRLINGEAYCVTDRYRSKLHEWGRRQWRIDAKARAAKAGRKGRVK